jgi:EmrB/QacA subfamily drug resistance transporter
VICHHHQCAQTTSACAAARTEQRLATNGAWDARLWATLVILCGVLFLDGLDVSMVGVALPSIRADLGLSTTELQWIVSGYVLGYGGLLLLGGRCADLLGRRRVLIAALSVFTVASLLGGLAGGGFLLIATRFLKGASAAFTAPASLSMITTTFPEGPARNRALSVYTACGASGFSLGLVLGGLLTEIGWRWTFLLPVPIAFAILVAAPRLLPRDGRFRFDRRAFDFAGAATVTVGMLLLVRTVVRAPSVGWGDPATIAGVAIAACLLIAFVAIERRVAQPLVRLGILRSGSLRRANLGAMATLGSYISFQFVATLYMQGLLGWSAIETALAFLPAGLIVAFGGPRVGPLALRYGTERLIAIGAVAFVIAYALFMRIDEDSSYVGVMLPSILLVGIGFALCFPSLNIQATAGVANEEQGLASGLLSTSFQVGGAIVLAIVSAVVTSETGSATDAGSLLDGYRPALAVATLVALLGFAVAVSGVVRSPRSTAPATAR